VQFQPHTSRSTSGATLRVRTAGLCAVAVLSLATGCSDVGFDVLTDLPDGEYEVMLARPAVTNQFFTPAWMYATPTIHFSKNAAVFVVTASTDDLVVRGPVQLAQRGQTSWTVRFGWAPQNPDHYWRIEMNGELCSALAVDADLDVGVEGGLVVRLRECTIRRR